MKIGIFGNKLPLERLEQIKKVFNKLSELKANIWVEEDFYHCMKNSLSYSPHTDGLITGNDFTLDMAISFGGDGTFLRTAALIEKKDIPILGINAGRLGFLADTGNDDIEETLDEIFSNDYNVEERTLLRLHTEKKIFKDYNYALNEIAILKRDTSSMISIRTYLNEEYLTDYLADGLLVATPTGSTAYSMSVDGPIIVPQAKSLVLSPVAPHSLNVRPLVIPDDYQLTMEVESRSHNFLIALDGRSEVFPTRTKLSIRKANFTLKIVKRNKSSFYKTLRDKLMWGADGRFLR